MSSNINQDKITLELSAVVDSVTIDFASEKKSEEQPKKPVEQR